jgi:hypothetical protein
MSGFIGTCPKSYPFHREVNDTLLIASRALPDFNLEAAGPNIYSQPESFPVAC